MIWQSHSAVKGDASGMGRRIAARERPARCVFPPHRGSGRGELGHDLSWLAHPRTLHHQSRRALVRVVQSAQHGDGPDRPAGLPPNHRLREPWRGACARRTHVTQSGLIQRLEACHGTRARCPRLIRAPPRHGDPLDLLRSRPGVPRDDASATTGTGRASAFARGWTGEGDDPTGRRSWSGYWHARRYRYRRSPDS
jgi:hypothetical protein